MPRRATLIVAGTLLAVASAAWWSAGRGDAAERSSTEASTARTLANASPAVSATAALQRADAREVDVQVRGHVVGRVLDADGQACRDATVALSRPSSLAPDSMASVAVDGEGRFAWRDLEPGVYHLRAATVGGAVTATVVAPADGVELRMPWTSGAVPVGLRVLAVDRFGAPVADAEVEALGEFAGRETTQRGHTDGAGQCALAGAPCPRAVVVVRAADGRCGAGLHGAGHQGAALEVVLDVPGAVAGTVRVRGGGEALVDGARVQARLGAPPSTGRGHPVCFEAPIRGLAYEFDALPAGVYEFALVGGACHGVPAAAAAVGTAGDDDHDAWPEPATVSVAAGERARCDLVAAAGATLVGVVQDATGHALAGARVHLVRVLRGGRAWQEGEVAGAPVEPAREPAGSLHPGLERSTFADAGGGYRFDGLVPGPHRLIATAAGHASARDPALVLQPGQGHRRDMVLMAAGGVVGRAGMGTVVVVWPVAGGEPRAVASDVAGAFACIGLPAARYCLGVVEADALANVHLAVDALPAALAQVDIAPHTNVFVDLVAQLPVRLGGQIVDRGGALDGAVLTLAGRRTTVGRDGRFEFRFAAPIRGSERLGVEFDGVQMAIDWPAAACSVREWFGAFELDTVPTTLRALGADRVPMPAVAYLDGRAHGRVAIGAGGTKVRLPRGTTTARVEFADGAVVERAFAAGGEVEFVAASTGVVRVLVTARDGTPLRRTQVRAATWVAAEPAPAAWSAFAGAGQVASREGVTDAAGRVTLRGVPVGPVVVVVKHGFGAIAGGRAETRTVLGTGQVLDIHLVQE
jgi:hypothetical protein